MQQFFDTLQDVNGNALVAGSIVVTLYPSGAAATVYADNGLTPTSSSIACDNTGQVSFFAADGDYIITYKNAGTTYKTRSPVGLFDGPAQLTWPDTGAVNAYATGAQSALEKVLRAGLRVAISVAAAHGNTGASTFAYNGLVAKPIIFPSGAALQSGALAAGGIYQMEYDGANWQLRHSEAPPYYNQTAAEITLSIAPASYQYPVGDPRRSASYVNPNWLDYGDVPTYISATSFSVPGDVTARYPFASRVRVVGPGGSVNARVQAAVFGSGITTYTVAPDSGNVPNPATTLAKAMALNSDDPGVSRWDLNNSAGGVFAWNVNNGALAVSRFNVAIGQSGLGAQTSCNWAAVGPAFGEYITGSGVTGKQIIIHTGTLTPILIATNDQARMIFDVPGSAIRVMGAADALALISPREGDSLGGISQSWYRSAAQGGARKGYFGFSNGGTNNQLELANEEANSAVKITATSSIWLSKGGAAANGIFVDNVASLAIYTGNGNPNGVVTANPGCDYFNSAGGAGVSKYVKEAGVGTNLNWVGK